MNVAQIPERSLSLLRLLTNYYIDKDAASILLDGEPMEVILDIQTVLLIGIVAEEREEDTLPDPQGTYERCRARTQVIGDYYEEIQYLLKLSKKFKARAKSFKILSSFAVSSPISGATYQS